MENEFFVMRDEPSAQGLRDLISYMGNTSNMDMIEIGSYVGESTQIFCGKFKTVTSIDPYINDYDPDDDACNYADFDLVYKEFIKNTKDIDNIFHFRLTSDTFVSMYDTKVDFVYIDGLHTEEQVFKDIVNYKEYVKKGGYIGGHDYHPRWKGVVNAIHEVLGEPDKVFQDGSWIKQL
jgi:hypothetical protein